MTFSNWLQNKFLEWEKSTGHRQSYAAFARYLKVKQPTLNRWLNDGIIPSYDYIILLGYKLSPEIYDILNIPKPDSAVHELEAIYQFLPSDKQTNLEYDFDKWLSDWLTAHGFKRIK
jgi:transcriptional regulator with XRE-family HTH domain